MSGSVRDRVRRLEPETPSPTRATRNSQTASGIVNTSVRERASAAKYAAEDKERLRPPDNRRFSAIDSAPQAPQHTPGVRERIEQEQRIERDRATPTTESLSDAQRRNADEWEQFERDQAVKQKRWEEEREQAQRDRIKAEQDEQARIKAEQDERVKRFPVELMFSSASATPAEIKRVTDLVNANCPQHRYNVEKQFAMLLELRSITAAKPDWMRRIGHDGRRTR